MLELNDMKTYALLFIFIIFSANVAFASAHDHYLSNALNGSNLKIAELSTGKYYSKDVGTTWSIKIDKKDDLAELKNILSHMRYCGLVLMKPSFKLKLTTQKNESILLELHIGFSSCFIRYRVNGVANDYWDDGLVLHAFLKRIIENEEKRIGKKFTTPYNSIIISIITPGSKSTEGIFRIEKPISVLEASKLIGFSPTDDTKFTLFKGDGIFGNKKVIDCDLWECVKFAVEAGDTLFIYGKQNKKKSNKIIK